MTRHEAWRPLRAGLIAAAVVAACAASSPLAAQRGRAPGTAARDQRATQPPTGGVPNLAGRILTVTGPIDPAALGPTLMHEHIFIDFQRPVPVPPRFSSAEEATLYEQPLTMSTLSRTRYARGVRDSAFLGDFDESYREVMEFKKVGGGAIVDVSGIGLGRDPKALQRMAHATGLAIVMGASWYIKPFHPLDMDQRTVDQLTDVIVRDVTTGVEGTGIRSGIIGEIGIDGGPLTPNELKVIRASARASRLTGAPMTFHAGGVDEERLTTIDVSLSEGVDPSQIIMGHSGALTPNLPLVKRMLEKGVYFQIDYLGVMTGPGGVLGNRSDRTIAKAIAELVALGHADRILLSHDICTKPQLKKYGGSGFSYITEYFLPELRRLGLSEETIHKFMVDNPRRALTFVAPRPRVPIAATAARR